MLREGNVTQVDQPRMQTFGASIDDLSQFVFLDDAVSPRYRQQLAKWARTKGLEIGLERVIDEYGQRLSPVTLSIIADAMKTDD